MRVSNNMIIMKCIINICFYMVYYWSKMYAKGRGNVCSFWVQERESTGKQWATIYRKQPTDTAETFWGFCPLSLRVPPGLTKNLQKSKSNLTKIFPYLSKDFLSDDLNKIYVISFKDLHNLTKISKWCMPWCHSTFVF